MFAELLVVVDVFDVFAFEVIDMLLEGFIQILVSLQEILKYFAII
jgi:hypothetical protein